MERQGDAAAAPFGVGLDWHALSQGERSDPLLDCLVYLSGHYGRPHSAEVLVAGLAMRGPRLTPRLFLRAAERSGLRAKVVKRPLAEIPPQVLPAVLVMEDGGAVVLTARDGDVFKLVRPGHDTAAEVVDSDWLSARYAGYAIYCRPTFDLHRQAANLGGDKAGIGQHWFFQTIVMAKWVYIQVILAAITVNLFALATPIFSMAVYDRIIPNSAVETLWVLAVGVAIVLIADFVIKTLRAYFIETAGKKADVILACRLFDQALDIKLAARPASSGGFAATLREFETLREFFTAATLTTLTDLPFILLFVGVIALISGPVALVLLVAFVLILGYGGLIQYPLRAMVHAFYEEGCDRHGVLVETINGLETIKSIGAEGHMRTLWETNVGRAAHLGERARALSLSAVNFTNLLQQFAFLAVMVIGVHQVVAGDLSTGGLIACSILAQRAIAPVGQIAQLLTRLHQAMNSLRALDKLMAAPTERRSGQTFLSRPHLRGEITFSNVSFSYPSRLGKALQQVNFTLKAGEKVAFIGRIGSGKSTIARLLLGLYEPTEGSVLVDGTDIRQIDPVDLRRNIGYVAQDGLLFRGSLRDNIAITVPHAEDSWLLRVAELAGVDEFVRTTSSGYDLPVGERGEGLSGGQRQLVAVARALLRDPPILVLDEPSSALDARSEEALIQRVKRHLQDKTVVLVTHRSSLLSLVDRVIVLDGGRVMADGPRASVLEALAAGRVSAARN